MRFAWLVALVGCSGGDDPPPVDAPADVTTVYVVRHAETGSTATDPPLDATGQARAQTLAGLLADAGIELVIASQFMRTQQTGTPTATTAGLIVTVHAVAGTGYGAELATQVKTAAPHAALIVGHSNTVPETVQAFTGTAVAPIAETEFDRLYTITVTATGATAVESSY